MKSASSAARFFVAAICFAFLLCASATTLQAQEFSNPRRIVTGQDPSSINVADLNGDGHPDLLYGIPNSQNGQRSTGAIHTLLWQTGGIYVAGPILRLPADTNTLCRTGDLNGDGLPDLLCPSVTMPASGYSTSVVFFAGRGDGSFGSPVYSPVKQPGPFSYSLAYPLLSTFADANRDGKMDVLVVDPQAEVTYVLLGNGDGTFSFAGYGNGGNGVWQMIDLNGDGIPDLVDSNGPSAQLGKGDGTFSTNDLFTTSSFLGCAYGDVDGDGHPDAVCAYSQTTGSMQAGQSQDSPYSQACLTSAI